MAEILAPTRKPVTEEFQRGFAGMTTQPVTIDELVAAREKLIASIAGKVLEPHRRFLLSFKRGEPDWSLLRIPGVSELPAVRWRQQNLDKLTSDERIRLVLRLENVFAQASAAE